MTRFSLFSKEDAAMKKNLFRSRLSSVPLRHFAFARPFCAPAPPRATLFLPPYMNRRLRS